MLRDIPLQIFYAGPGRDIARDLLQPALSTSNRYDRLAGYFTVGSLVAVAEGLDGLRANGGHVRLIVGAHALDPELVAATHAAAMDQVVASLRQRIVQGVSTLTDELRRDRIETVGWMLRDGMLEVRCARVIRGTEALPGIFHSKRLIFSDAFGDVVSASGSPNETVSGLGGNYEEVTVHMSWAGGAPYTSAHQTQFEEVWGGDVDGLEVAPIDQAFGDELLAALGVGRPRRPPAPRLARPLDVVRLLRDSPLMAAVNSSQRPLFPHQERVLIEATSRWPVRALLADEVGLGKTYEAAAVVKFAVDFLGVERVVILVPPSLARQWQDELADSFGMDFWRFDSYRREFVSASGAVRQAMDGPFGRDYPSRLIVSRDLVRGTRRRGHAFGAATILPDMVVLDEAHAARKRRGPTGSSESLLRKMMRDISRSVPHLLCLTATPMQMDEGELRDLLELLSLPPEFTDEVYRKSLSLLSRGTLDDPDMQEVSDAVDILEASRSWFAPRAMGRHNVGPIVDAAVASDGTRARLQATVAARRAWPTVFEGLVQFHPAALLILRNTRGALERIGYSFPERIFDSIEPVSPHQVLTLLRAVERYLSEALGTVERAMWSERSNPVGFLTATYQQRIASSLQSAFDTLRRRSDRLLSLLTGEPWSDEETDEDEDDSADAWADEDTERLTDAVRRACEVELSYIRPILQMFEDLKPTPRAIDPKMVEAMEQLRSGLDAGHSCLVFSKYTSTVRSLIESFRDAFGTTMPFATYTGGTVEVFDGTTRRRSSKKDVTDALDASVVRVVFCSDAASEGLNLQTASVLINVDVPWNPAKLEQRIGRVARVGQREPTVKIVNLWYPGSIEKEIYSRLLARKDLLDLAVGTYPEIVSEAIRSAVSDRSREASLPTPDLLAELQTARKSTQLRALSRVWNRSPTERLGWQGTSEFRARLLAVLERAATVAGWTVTRVDGAVRFASGETAVEVSADVDARSGFTLAARWITSLLGTLPPKRSADGELAPLMIVEAEGVPLLLGCEAPAGGVVVLRPDSLPDVLDALIFGTKLDLDAGGFVSIREGDPVEAVHSALVGWWPNPTELSTPTPSEATTPPLPTWSRHTAMSFKRIGAVPVQEVRT